MRLRHLAYGALALGLVSTTTSALAAAKPKPLCNLITDKAGDGKASGIIASDALDILSGDVATGKKTLVGVLRMKTTNAKGDPAATLGMRMTLRFTVQGTTYVLWRRVSSAPANSDTFGMSINNVEVPDNLKPKVTMTATTITWTVARSQIVGLKKPKSLISELGSTTYINSTNADAADSTAKYPDLAASCVKAS